MFLAAIIATASLASAVDDYFPLITGTKWTYQDANGLELVDEVGPPVDIGKGRSVIPKTASVAGRRSASELYHSEGDTMFLVGYWDPHAKFKDPNLLGEPQPILKIGAGKSNWSYVGELPTSLGPVSLQVHGESNKGGMRKVLDRLVETVNVHVTSKIGNQAQAVEIKQDVIYAKGIGMVEMTEVTKAQGQNVKKVLTLVKFEPPQG